MGAAAPRRGERMTDDAAGTELAEIQRTLRDAPDEYWRDKDMQGRFLVLLGSDSSAKQRVAAPATEVRERREIEKQMGNLSSPYWKGPDSARLRARYLELVGGAAAAQPQASADQEKPLPAIPKGVTVIELAAARTAADVVAGVAVRARSSSEAGLHGT